MAITRRPHTALGDRLYRYTDTTGGFFVRVEGFLAGNGPHIASHKVDAPAGSSLAEAMMLRDRIYREIEQGTYRRRDPVSDRPWTVGIAIDRYLERNPELRETSRAADRSRAKHWRRIAHVPLPALRRDDVQKTLDEVREAGASITHLRRLLTLMRSILAYARSWGQRVDFVADQVKIPGHVAERVEQLPDLDRIASFLNDLQTEELSRVDRGRTHYVGLALAYRVQFLCGMRPGEALGLRWSWLDRESRHLRIPASFEKSHIPKSVPIHPHLIELLDAHRNVLLQRGTVKQQRDASSSTGLVFPSRDGKVAKMAAHQLWERTCLRGGMEPGARGWSPHKLRYAAASRWRSLGIDERVIMAWMGHRQPMQHWHYAKPFERDVASAKAMLEDVADYLDPPPKKQNVHERSRT